MSKIPNLMDVKKQKAEEFNPSFVERIRAFDLLDPVGGEMGTSFIIPPSTGKITEVAALKSTQWSTGWIYTHSDPKRFCHIYTMTAENMGYIPPRCMGCWKVVARPKTLMQLFMVFDAQLKMSKEDNDCWCKCGIEERPWVFGNYGAYFYNNSEEEGLKKYEWVRKEMDKIDPEMSVILKRGCTEFEQKFGPSDKWDEAFDIEKNQTVKGWEGLIDEHIVVTKTSEKQSDLVRKHVMNLWIDFAYDRGDPTVLTLNDGKPMYIPYVTYHNKIKKGVKKNGKKSGK